VQFNDPKTPKFEIGRLERSPWRSLTHAKLRRLLSQRVER